MSGHWKNVQEAANGFRDILDKNLTKLVVADFRLKLSRSIQENETFRKDMIECGALVHWTDEIIMKWVITKEIINESLTAIERHYGKNETTRDKSKVAKRNAKLDIKAIVQQLQSQNAMDDSDTALPLIKSAYEPSATPKTKVNKTRAINYSASSEDDSMIIPETKIVAGKPMEILTPQKYIKIQEIIPRPALEYKEMFPIHSSVAFLVQKIKMWGCNALTAEKLAEMFLGNATEAKDEKSNFMQLIQAITDTSSSTKIQENENLAPLCKLDIFSCLSTVTEITVLAEMFRVLSKFPQTLPLILPNFDNQGNATHILLSPVLQKCLIRWEVADRLVENYLFLSPFKLITAIRLGTHRTGKSTFLNQLFESSNTFQCRGQPGGQRGAPVSVTAGSVEFIWLIESTCRSSTWTAVQNAQMNLEDKSEIVLLANLHGDIMDHLDMLKAISPMTSQFLAFVMPDAVKDITVSAETIANICGQENISLLFVDPEGIRLPDTSILKTSEILHDETLQKLNKSIKDAVLNTQSISGFQPKIREKSVKIIDRVETPESEDFVNFVKAINEKLKTKNEGLRGILCLQKKIAHKNFDDDNGKLWDSSPNLQELMSLFVKIIKLPLKSRRLALGHVEQELALLSVINTDKRSKELTELIKIKNSYKMDSMNTTSDFSLPQVKNEIKKIYAELGKSLGMEDLLRELGFVYELMTSKSIDLPIYSDLPEYYAELLIEGMTLEILDGDLGVISVNWLESVCHSVCKKMPKLKVYVISILGLQSSGKSTLLNALFGCKFAVSVGKCTRGLFMRLMLLEKSYRKKLKIDAILIVDTEGLGAPENMTGADSKLKDRKMATFAMTISNLTLVNVLGESKNEVANIMQIVILTMARMDEADLAPDILLVQHVAEGGQEYKIKEGVSQFCSALDEAVSVAKNQILNLGVKTLNNLKNIKERVKNQELLAQIRPFKSGASPQSPPTEGYHEDVIKLRNQIITELTRKSQSQISFCTWHKLLNSYWNAVQTHNFALQFIDIRQVQEYIDVNGRISRVKRKLDAAFVSHQKNLHDRFIKDKLASLNPGKDFKSSKTFDDEFRQEIKAIIESLPDNCQGSLTTELTPCKKCQLANDKMKELFMMVKQTSSISLTETEENLKIHIVELQKSSISRMLRVFESEKIKVGKASEFENMLAEIIKSTKGPMQSPSVDIIWEELLTKVRQLYPIKNIRQIIFEDILKYYNQAPDIQLWKQALELVPLTKDDPQPTLTPLAAKKKTLFSKKNLNLTANEHNWLCEKMAQMTEQVILKRNNKQQSYYSAAMLEQHQAMVADVLQKFEKQFRITMDDAYPWKAILYSLQLLAYQLIQFQNDWNELNEPYFILLSEKQEYLKKIDIYLELQRGHTKNENVSKIASTLAEKLLKAAVIVTINSWGTQSHFRNWDLEPESVRLHYLIALAEYIKGGNADVVLENFRNPRQIITEWYTMTSEHFVRDTHVPILKKTFLEENAAIIAEIHKTRNSQQLNKFVAWYLGKMKDSVSDSEIITDEMFSRNIKEMIKKELEERAEEYHERICLESIPLDYDSFSNSIGCTATCPQCSALCWGFKGHEHNLIRYKNHFTCHQPKGLAGVVDSSGTLVLTSCSDVEGSDQDNLTSIQSISEDNANNEADVPWVKTKHIVDEYSLLMQWFFFKLNKSLAQFYQVNPASDEAMKAFGFHNLEAQLDNILNVIRHKSEM